MHACTHSLGLGELLLSRELLFLPLASPIIFSSCTYFHELRAKEMMEVGSFSYMDTVISRAVWTLWCSEGSKGRGSRWNCRERNGFSLTTFFSPPLAKTRNKSHVMCLKFTQAATCTYVHVRMYIVCTAMYT